MLLANEQKQIVSEHFSKAASHYDSAAQLQKYVLANAVKLLNLSANSDVIDMGCGTGNLLTFLSSVDNRLINSYTGIDLAEGMLLQAQQKALGLKFKTQWLHADVQQTHLESGAYSHIFSSLVWQWCDLPSVLAESYRLLKPGGSLVFTTLLEGTLAELSAAYKQLDDQPHVNQFESKTQLEFALYSQNWSQLNHYISTEITQYSNVHTLLRELKSIGANSVVGVKQPQGLTKKRLKLLEAAYPESALTTRMPTTSPMPSQPIQASWRVAYCSLVK